MSKKNVYAFFVILFFVISIIPSAGIAIFGESEARANEVLTQRPGLFLPDGSCNMNYTSEITDYFTDRFAGRQMFITLYAKIQAFLFQESSSDQVVLGKDGWLFYTDTLDDYLHRDPLSNRRIQGICRTLELMQEYAESKDCAFLFTVVPNKNSLQQNAKYMPEVGEKYRNANNLALLEKAVSERKISYISLLSVLDKEGLYYRLDSHWNKKGAAYAFEEISNTMGRQAYPWTREEYTIEKSHKGDLYEMLYPAGKELDKAVCFDRMFSFSYIENDSAEPFQKGIISTIQYGDAEAPPPDAIKIETSNENKMDTLLMFRDSFGNDSYPFFADEFERAAFSRQMPYRMDWLEAGNVDYLVVEIVERNIGKLANYAPIMPAKEFMPKEVFASEEIKKVKNSVQLQIVPSDLLDGYVQLSGIYDDKKIDEDTRIFICFGDDVFEACPTGSSLLDENTDCCFTAYIPEGKMQENNLHIVLQSGGEFVLCDCEIR